MLKQSEKKTKLVIINVFQFGRRSEKILIKNIPYGIKLPNENDIHKSLINRITLLKKLIPINPRKVHLAPEIKAKFHSHPKKEVIHSIASRLSKGLRV